MTDIKEPQEPRQKEFFKYLIEFDGNIMQARDKMSEPYTKEYCYELARKYSSYIISLAESSLYLDAVRAATTLRDGLSDDGTKAGADNRYKAATAILDRIGLGKKETIQVETDAPNTVFILPPKEKND